MCDITCVPVSVEWKSERILCAVCAKCVDRAMNSSKVHTGYISTVCSLTKGNGDWWDFRCPTPAVAGTVKQRISQEPALELICLPGLQAINLVHWHILQS